VRGDNLLTRGEITTSKRGKCDLVVAAGPVSKRTATTGRVSVAVVYSNAGFTSVV
jgi:hypothetical protein